MALTDKLTTIANAIREKAGTSDALTLDGMAEAIAAIQAGGGEVTINGCKVLCGEYVSAEDMATGAHVIIFSQIIGKVQPVAGLFYSASIFVYDDRPFLSASGSGLNTSSSSTLASQVGYSSNGSSAGKNDGFELSYVNGKFEGSMNLNSAFAIPAGRIYHWIAIYR